MTPDDFLRSMTPGIKQPDGKTIVNKLYLEFLYLSLPFFYPDLKAKQKTVGLAHADFFSNLFFLSWLNQLLAVRVKFNIAL